LDILDLLEFQDFLASQSKYIKYKVRDTGLTSVRKKYIDRFPRITKKIDSNI